MKRYICILTAAALALLVSCVKQESGPDVAKAVLGDVSVMHFEARNPAAQTLTVVSDGPWHTTAPAWITVSPDSGSGECKVTVSAAENADASGLLEPRRDTVILSGNKLSSRHLIIVTQDGDAYRNAEHATVSQVVSLADGKSFILDEATVAAVTGAGFVVTDGSANLYVKAAQEVSVGDKVSLKGLKGTANGVAVVTQADECTVKGSGTCTYPDPLDLNERIAGYEAKAMDYVKASGIVSGGNLVFTVDETEYAVKQLDAPAGMSLAALNGHKATVWGYSYGLAGAKMLGLLAVNLQDDGLDQLIYFEDDFEWMEPWTSAAGAGDDVTANTVNTDTAPNVFANADALAEFIAEFQKRGYGYVWGWKDQEWSDGDPDNGNKRTLYLQRNYLKFGKTNYSSGIILPVLSAIEGGDDITVSFDWCYCMTGGNKPDLTTLKLVVTGGGLFENGTAISDEIVSGQVVADDGTTSLAWQHAEVRINGATSATRITIRPANNDPDVTNSARHQNRWYLDNIKVLPAQGGGSGGGGGVKPGTLVYEDDFEWIESWATATSSGDAVKDNNPSTTAPNVFTTAECDGFMQAFIEKGYTYYWAKKGDTEWHDSLGDDTPKVLYLQANYLKFGKTEVNAAIMLPALSSLTATANVELTFDWCWQVTGAYKPDLMTLAIKVEGDGSPAEDELASAQSTVDGESKIEWQHASVTINGAGANTRIFLAPANPDPRISNPDRGQNRWYLDNIKIVTK